MAGLILEFSEANILLKEIVEYTVRGLVEPDIRCKQFYFERIWLSLGMSLADYRKEFEGKGFEVLQGVNPE